MQISTSFLITLKRRKDRLLYFNNNVKNKLKIPVEIPVEIIEAVDGRTLKYDKELLSRINSWNIVNGKPKRYGVIGCCLSHLKSY